MCEDAAIYGKWKIADMLNLPIAEKLKKSAEEAHERIEKANKEKEEKRISHIRDIVKSGKVAYIAKCKKSAGERFDKYVNEVK